MLKNLLINIFFFICVLERKKLKYIVKEKRAIRDVLFVNGCNPNIYPESYRYRVLNQIEQMNAGYLESSEIYYLNINSLKICDFRVIIFFRCPWTKDVDEAITLAKKLNKKVLFDIDDLIFVIKYKNINNYNQDFSPYEKELYNKNAILIRKTLLNCEGAITTTESLSKVLKNYISEVII